MRIMEVRTFFETFKMIRKSFPTFVCFIFLTVSLFNINGATAGERFHITVDHAKIMRINKPAATVIIGNPGIADATVQDAHTLVITGKSFGVTNLIVLDGDGEPIADALLTVRGERVDAVTVYRRTQRVTYSCSPNCERSLALGDNDDAFGSVKSQVEERNAFAGGAAPQQ